jgi:hypothetical protein
MDERKIAESTNSDALLHLRAKRILLARDALLHLRANRILLARRINEIALKMLDLRTELETLDDEMKAEAHQLKGVDRGIRAWVLITSARHTLAGWPR